VGLITWEVPSRSARPLQPLACGPCGPRRHAPRHGVPAPPHGAAPRGAALGPPCGGLGPRQRGPPAPPTAASAPPWRGSLASPGAAPWPPHARPLGPLRAASAFGSVDPSAVPERVPAQFLRTSPFTQRVPASAAPRAR
jgi:hypothetical protein